jgi:hypothetical protein
VYRYDSNQTNKAVPERLSEEPDLPLGLCSPISLFEPETKRWKLNTVKENMQ